VAYAVMGDASSLAAQPQVLTGGVAPDARRVDGGTGRAPVAERTTTRIAAERQARKQKPRWRYRKPGRWKTSPHVTWYGPGFYGNRTACGQRYTRYIVGVAHRSLPCGTMVQFRWRGKSKVAPVIDRGPYGPKTFKFDWSAFLACKVYKPKRMRNGCFTRYDVRYRVVGKVDLDRWFARKRR
jgi:hypothetical protein